MKLSKLCVVLGFSLFSFLPQARAVDVLDTAEYVFFDPADPSRFWVEIEGRFDTDRNVLRRLERLVQGQFPISVEPERMKAGPLGAAHLDLLERAVDLVDPKAAGPRRPLRTRVSVQAPEARVVLNLLRSYFRPEHESQIRAHFKAEGIEGLPRQTFSPGMFRRILEADYGPNLQTFVGDYFYRQALEKIGDRRAWSLPIAEVRRKVLERVTPRILRQLDSYPIRLAALFASRSPDDPLVAKLRAEGLVPEAPGSIELEFRSREAAVVSQVKQALGLIRGAEKYGYYDHDRLMSQLSGVEVATIVQLRRAVNRDGRKGNVIFRYFSADPESLDDEDRAEYRRVLSRFYRDTPNGVVGFLDPSTRGLAALHFPGVAFHRLSHHKTSVLGFCDLRSIGPAAAAFAGRVSEICNPGLVNEALHDALANKWVEFNFWREFAPYAMPETIQLSELIPRKGANVQDLAEKLNRRFPYGWVLKPVWGFGSETAIITDKIDIIREVNAYLASDFDEFYAELEPYYEGDDPQYFIDALKSDEDYGEFYRGWQIHNILKQRPELFIVQSRMPIEREFRVEVWGGKVLGGRSTIDRYRYRYLYEENLGTYRKPAAETIARVEAFAQALVDALPPKLRETPFAMDVALLYDGNLKLVESNPGGNSLFLAESDEEPGGILKIGRYLREYRARVARGELKGGMTPAEQIRFLLERFERWGIDRASMYEGVTFTETSILDPEYALRGIDPEEFAANPSERCIRLLTRPSRR